MSTVTEIFGVLGLLCAIGVYQWITTINASVASYAERIWIWASLLFGTIAVSCLFIGIKNLFFEDGEYGVTFLGAFLVTGCIAYACYLAWSSALHEESD
jgi:hypothetical protein